MKVVVGMVFGVLAVLGLSLAAGRNAPDRPPGIAADRWAPISDTLGFVLVPDSDSGMNPLAPFPVGAPGVPVRSDPIAPVDRGAPVVFNPNETDLIAAPSPAVLAIIEEGHPVRGYIMVKRGKLWRPLTVVPPTVND